MADEFVEFPKVRLFENVVASNSRTVNAEKVVYGAKVKLHGTNCGVRICNGRVTPQRRHSDLSLADDSFQFAAWVKSTANAWVSKNECVASELVVVFGEWAGKGVQGASIEAVEQVEPRSYFVFGVMVGERYFAEPSAISRYVPDIPRVYVIPWLTTPTDSRMVVRFSRLAEMVPFANYLSDTVEQVDAEDPYILSKFGIKGRGEGVVVMPISVDDSSVTWKQFQKLVFKAKSVRHRGKRSKGPACRVKNPPPAGIEQFVETFVTEPRCVQGVHEACEGQYDKSRIQDFYLWMKNDVYEESELERSELNSEWDEVQKFVIKAAAKWYVGECNRLQRVETGASS